MAKLNKKQSLFIEYYLQSFNATQSAIQAGYSKRTAYRTGADNLKKPQIRQIIDEEMKRLRERMAEDSNKAYAKLWSELNEVEAQIEQHKRAKEELFELQSQFLDLEVEYGTTPQNEIPQDAQQEMNRLQAEIKKTSHHLLKEHNWLKAQELRAGLLHDIMDRGGYKATDKIQLDATVKVDPVTAIIQAAKKRMEKDKD